MTSVGVTNWLLGLPGRYKQLLVMATDVLLAELTLWITLSLRYEIWSLPLVPQHWALFVLSPLIAFPVFVRCGLYRAIFRYSGFGATAAIARAVAIYTIAFGACVLAMGRIVNDVPRTVAIIQPFLFSWAVLGTRMLGGMLLSDAGHGLARKGREKLLVFGAGVSGIQTFGALQASGRYQVVGFVDDTPAKVGRQIMGVNVLSRTAAEPLLRDKLVNGVVLALPNVARNERNAILAWLQPYGVHVQSIPSVIDLATGQVTLADMRELDIEDLLGRDPLPLSLEYIARDVVGQVILVTGAGGILI